eukprot:TRINITY_DN7417_c0_g1_i3.p1 TRINITY_DN7417_c0_g1~~TRINITY_DN7417_c0_g1_i3.p1  ORF type:complete len:423 (+),score=87.59 TRINITY_DN7417_c0_g1_i3:214-1482(+)
MVTILMSFWMTWSSLALRTLVFLSGIGCLMSQSELQTQPSTITVRGVSLSVSTIVVRHSHHHQRLIGCAGFNAEDFVTGGANHLRVLLSKLKARNISAILDLHAQIGGSSKCSSYSGTQVPNGNESFWLGSPPADSTTPITACGGNGPYTSSRGNAQTYMEVGVELVNNNIVKFMNEVNANSSTSGVLVGFELINEPALGWDGMSTYVQDYVLATAKATWQAAHVTPVLNFITPNEEGMAQFVVHAQNNHSIPHVAMIDFHHYYNWAGPRDFQQLIDGVCKSTNSYGWQQYTQANLPTFIGEWALASNLNDPLMNDINNQTVKAFLKVFFANQMSLLKASPDGLIGHAYWSARMGSGWDPRPTDDHPKGHQVEGTNYKTSAKSFAYADWNLAELIRTGIAVPLTELEITGVCQCKGCQTSWP